MIAGRAWVIALSACDYMLLGPFLTPSMGRNRSIPRLPQVLACRQGTLGGRVCRARRGRKRWILSVPLRGELWMDEGVEYTQAHCCTLEF